MGGSTLPASGARTGWWTLAPLTFGKPSYLLGDHLAKLHEYVFCIPCDA